MRDTADHPMAHPPAVDVDPSELIVRTDLRYDPDQVLQLALLTADGTDLRTKPSAVVVSSEPPDGGPSVLVEAFRGTYVEEILSSLPFRHGLVRLLSIPPQKCYPIHVDGTIRYHLAVDTHPFTYILYPSLRKMYHIPRDGFLYRMDATRPHTAVNCGPLPRTHLVIVLNEQ